MQRKISRISRCHTRGVWIFFGLTVLMYAMSFVYLLTIIQYTSVKRTGGTERDKDDMAVKIARSHDTKGKYNLTNKEASIDIEATLGGTNIVNLEQKADPSKKKLIIESTPKGLVVIANKTETKLTEIENKRGANVNRLIKKETLKRRAIDIEAFSSSHFVKVTVNGLTLVEKRIHNTDNVKSRGIHVVVINQYNGLKMAHESFDTYFPYFSFRLNDYLKALQSGRIVILMVLDEASLSFHQQDRHLIQTYGSRFITKLSFRNTWVFAFKKGYSVPGEGHSHLGEDFKAGKNQKHGDTSHIEIKSLVLEKEDSRKCAWTKSRKSFCDKYDGYGDLCDCLNPRSLNFVAPNIRASRIDNVPIAVIASNRPKYLYRMLTQLLQTPGVKRKNIHVFVDGSYIETIDVAALLGVFYKQNAHLCDGKCGISLNYKSSLTYIFDSYLKSNHVIILEEDLLVSRDIMDYFSQLLPVLDADESLYCISAWNDHGYYHSSNDPSMLYRVETMPGLGWILKRIIYKEELERDWPGVNWDIDWDIWVRKLKLKDRECVIPDIPRTFHFGSQGVNMNEYMHQMLFKAHALNNKTGLTFDVDKIQKQSYEEELRILISSAQVLNHTKSPCKDKDFIPNTVGHSYVIYIKYSHKNDFDTWLSIAKCLNIYSMEARGIHKRMFRLWIRKNMLFVVGSTSPYAVYKPKDVEPLHEKQS